MFTDKKVVITGGSSGIGKQLAIDFLRLGAHVTIVSSNLQRLNNTKQFLSFISQNILVFDCDISDLGQMRRMVLRYNKQVGTPDILVNNAGFAVYRTFEESSSEEIARLLNVNLLGAMYCTREFLPFMLESGGGHIVNVSSVAGKFIITPNATYCAAKHGMVAWSETLKVELSRFGIRIHVICPGRVETDFFMHETFKNRASRKETEYTVPVETVSSSILTAIERNKFLTFVPKTFGFLAWLTNIFPWPVKSGIEQLMKSRIETLYKSKKISSQQYLGMERDK